MEYAMLFDIHVKTSSSNKKIDDASKNHVYQDENQC